MRSLTNRESSMEKLSVVLFLSLSFVTIFAESDLTNPTCGFCKNCSGLLTNFFLSVNPDLLRWSVLECWPMFLGDLLIFID